MSMQETISRINELSKIQKTTDLNEQQQIEQLQLRKIYLEAIRAFVERSIR